MLSGIRMLVLATVFLAAAMSADAAVLVGVT